MRSQLQVYDLEEGRARVLLDHDGHIEAPNWDGGRNRLIVNGNGLLYGVSLTDPALERIDTGSCTACNNDHGLTFDGAHILLSDKSQTGQSLIYQVPATGGVPVQITPQGPSYWHGVSPDGETITYVARRDDSFQVYSCPITGGAETQLSVDFDHCDGPEFTPDGKWIWFNGERDGAVDLWRMHPDGGALERMTQDGAVNWFPHPSPDGAQVLYLAYPAGTQGHPPLKQVQLCLMPAAGGETRALMSVLGGQGTINVPCWAPDGRRFAFVSYVV